MTTNSILPPNATAQELALEQAMRSGDDISSGVALIRTAKENPPDDWLMWLIYEYGLEELLPYLPDPRVALENGLVWQRIRGTPESLMLAFSWLGLSAEIEEETPGGAHWFEYQLDPGKIPTNAELTALVGLARLSAPVRSRLARVFHDYDRRRAQWDKCDWSDGSLWSTDSGVYDPELGIVVSFGRTDQIASSLFADVDILSYSQHMDQELIVHRYEDRLIYSYGDYDNEIVRNYQATELDDLTTKGQGAGRNLFILDGGGYDRIDNYLNGSFSLDGEVSLTGSTFSAPTKLDGTLKLNGVRRELNQISVVVTTSDYETDRSGWGNVGWADRTWTDNGV